MVFRGKISWNISNSISEVKDIKIFEDGFHEIHHDTDKDLFFKIINEFLQKRLQASPKNIGSL